MPPLSAPLNLTSSAPYGGIPSQIFATDKGASPEREAAKRVDYVLDRYYASEAFDRPFKDQCLKWWRQVNNVLPDNWPYFSKIFEPETMIVADDQVEQIMGQVFSKDRYFDVEAVEGQDEIQREMMRELMRFVLREHVKYKLLKYYQCQEGVYFGNGVEMHSVKPRIVTIRSRRPLVFNDGFQTIIGMGMHEERKMEFWPRAEIISRFDCYPAPTGATIQAMPYFLHRAILPLQDVKAMAKSAGYDMAAVNRLEGFWVNREDGVAGSDWSAKNFDLRERLRSIGLDVRDGIESAAGPGALEYVEILVYSEAPANDEGAAKICVIGNRKELLKEGSNPFAHGKKPYAEIKYSPRSAQLWQARGIPERIEHLQTKINQRSNQVSDIIELIRSPMTWVGKQAGVEDLNQLVPWPGGIVEMRDPNAVRERERPAPPNAMFLDLDYARARLQAAASSADYGRGIAGRATGLDKGTETATGISLLMNAQAKAVTFKWLLAEETGITEGLNLIAANIQQTMTGMQKVRILGENRVLAEAGWADFIEVRPEDIAGQWDIHAVGASRSLEAADQMAIMERLVASGFQMPEVAAALKQREIWLEGAELGGLRNPSRFLLSEEEVQAKQAQALQSQAMQSLAGLTAAPAEGGAP